VGLVVLLLWAAAAVLSVRLADRRVVRMHVVVALGTAVAFVSTARIFGKVWYYLTLWSWCIALLAMAVTIWTFVSWWEQLGRRRLAVGHWAVVVLVLAGAVFVRDAATVDPPEARLSRVLNALIDPTVAALRDGVGAADGPDGVYAVIWEDAYYFGSQGYGLISELERRGFTARAYATFRVPVTPQRITDPAHATAEVALVTGVNIADWRAKPGVVEVADFEPRSTAELDEFSHLRDDAIRQLRAAGLDDVAALVDTNLMGARLDPRLPAEVEPMLVRMLILGEATAIFIAPPGSF
jgi:hypothetical protein